MNRVLRNAGVCLIGVGVLCNQWVLSIFFPGDGFHIANALSKSHGAWDSASLLLIWTGQLGSLILGAMVIAYRRSPRKLLFSIVVLAASTFFSLFLLEGLLRILSPPNMFSPELALRPHNKLELHTDLHGVSPVAHNTTNRWGLRGDEPPQNWSEYTTIVVIGGSTAQCFYLDDHKTWAYLLQEKLKPAIPKVWVGNGGLSGQSTRGHIVFVREVIPSIRPTIVLLLVGANDLGFSMNQENREYGNPVERTGWRRFVFRNSRLIQLASLWKEILIGHAVVLDKGSNVNFVPEKLEREMELPADIRSILPGIDEYKQNLRTIIGDLRRLGSRPVFMTQPLLFDTTEEWKHLAGREYSSGGLKGTVSAASFAKMLDIYNGELKRICAEDSVEVLDLAPAIPHSTDHFYDVMHFNERGADLVAERIAHYLLSH